MTLAELLQNIFNATGGNVPPTAAVAAVYAMSVGRMFEQQGASDAEVADAYKYAFGDAFGWTREETDRFWADRSVSSASDADVHAYDAYVDWKRASDIRQNMETMRKP